MTVIKKASVILAVFFLSLSVCGSARSQTQHSEALVSLQTEVDCSEIIGTWVAEGDQLVENLTNPVLISEAEVHERVRFYRNISDCFSGTAELGEVEKKLLSLIDRFIALVDDSNHRIDYVDLAESEDRAVMRLRDEVGLAPPSGFVYVNHFADITETPRALADSMYKSFVVDEAEGIMIPSRFVVVLDEQGSSEEERNLHRTMLGVIISHELVHAYLHSTIEQDGSLPEWFDEGSAYYFSEFVKEISDTNVEDLLINILGSIGVTEFTEYKLVFRYLYSEMGESKFNDLIRWAVGTSSVDGIFLQTGSADYPDLLAKAKVWSEERSKIDLGDDDEDGKSEVAADSNGEKPNWTDKIGSRDEWIKLGGLIVVVLLLFLIFVPKDSGQNPSLRI
jgi:hypothetical protein